MIEQKLPMLPPNAELETKAVLKQLSRANRALAELKGYADTIPNKHILINLTPKFTGGLPSRATMG